MKAIIPVAGAGTTLRPHTYSQPKALIPIAGKTLLSLIIEQLKQPQIDELIFIIGYMGDKIREFVKKNYPELNCHFVSQNDRFGIGHAIELTKNIVGNDEIFIVLGDNICDYDIKEVIESPHSMIGIKKVDDPRQFGVATVGEDGFIEHLVEKPSIPKSNMALVGVYKIREGLALYECLTELMEEKGNNKTSYNLTDALDLMIKKGHKLKSFRVKNWFDCGKKETLLECNSLFLKKSGGNINSENVKFENTIIIPPVYIDENVKISNSIIGPHVAIGHDSDIQFSIVKDSIIGAYTNIYEVVLDNSLIGSDASVKGLSRKLNIGDNTELDFG